MPRERFQCYLEPDSAWFLNHLMTRYSWSPSEVLDRLLRFYNAATQSVEGVGVLVRGTEETLAFEDENGDVWPCEAPALEDVITKIQAGLTPRAGFADLPGGDIDHG